MAERLKKGAFSTGSNLAGQYDDQENLMNEMSDAISGDRTLTEEDLFRRIDPRLLERTRASQVFSDPRLNKYSQDQLDRLEEQIIGGGMDATDKSRLAQIQGQQSLDNRRLMDTQKSNLIRGGSAGGGLIHSLLGAGASAGASHQAGLGLASDSLQRRQQQMAQQQRLAQDMSAKDYQEQMERAGSEDQRNLTNAKIFNDANALNEQNRYRGVRDADASRRLKTASLNDVRQQRINQSKGYMAEDQTGWSNAAKLAERVGKGVASSGLSEAGGNFNIGKFANGMG